MMLIKANSVNMTKCRVPMGPGKSWKVLEFEKCPGKSWEVLGYVIFYEKFWKIIEILYNIYLMNFHFQVVSMSSCQVIM